MVIYGPDDGIFYNGKPVYVIQNFWSSKGKDIHVVDATDIESGDFRFELSTTNGAEGRI